MSSLPAFFAGKSVLTNWMENNRSSRVLKMDIPSVICVNKTKTKHVGKQEVN